MASSEKCGNIEIRVLVTKKTTINSVAVNPNFPEKSSSPYNIIEQTIETQKNHKLDFSTFAKAVYSFLLETDSVTKKRVKPYNIDYTKINSPPVYESVAKMLELDYDDEIDEIFAIYKITSNNIDFNKEIIDVFDSSFGDINQMIQHFVQTNKDKKEKKKEEELLAKKKIVEILWTKKKSVYLEKQVCGFGHKCKFPLYDEHRTFESFWEKYQNEKNPERFIPCIRRHTKLAGSVAQW